MIKIGQIGIGYWGPNLLRNLQLNSECTVQMVTDLSEERLQYVRNNYTNIQTSKEATSIFLDKTIDAVVIATPVQTHYSLALQALQSGKHVLIEKPMATSIKEIDDLACEAKKRSLTLMAGHTFIYNSAVRYIKSMISRGELGSLRYIYSQRLNLGRIRTDVDALWNFAPHDISIIQFWLDDISPLSISKDGMDFIQDGIDDVVFMTIRYPNKVLAHIHVSWLDPRKVRQMVVVGTKKMVVYDDISDDKIAIYDKGIDKKSILGENMDYDSQHRVQFSYRSGDLLLPAIEYQEPLAVEVQHFIDCIKGTTKCMTGPEHSRKVVQILSGIV